LRSNFLMAGPVPHKGIVYDKEHGIVAPRAPAARPSSPALE